MSPRPPPTWRWFRCSGPRLADRAVLDALGLDALPAELTAIARRRRWLCAPDARRTCRPDRTGLAGARAASPPAGRTAWSQAGVRPAGVWAYEAHRVAALRPRLGVDTDERTIPHEVGWIGGPGEGAVHLDKGCYRGQETVARVHNLGKPPRMLVLLHLDGSVDRPSTGDPVLAGGRAVGRARHRGRPRRPWARGAGAAQARGARRHRIGHRRRQASVAALIDADSLPPAEQIGAGRLAVERLRGGAR